MLHSKASGFAILAGVCLACAGTVGSVHAQTAVEWSGDQVIHLNDLPAPGTPTSNIDSGALAINSAGLIVGYSNNNSGGYAVEWNTRTPWRATSLGLGIASGVNDSGQVVGAGPGGAIEWSGGQVVYLGGLPGSTFSSAIAINNARQVVGTSSFGGNVTIATEWSNGQVIDLGGLPNSTATLANAINDSGKAVGWSETNGILHATEWSNRQAIDLGGLPGSTASIAYGINSAGQIVGISFTNGSWHATEWTGVQVIELGALPGAIRSDAFGINDCDRVVGDSYFSGGVTLATEWSSGQIIELGSLASSTGGTLAYAINDAGQAVGYDYYPRTPVPEPSTWAMVLLGFAGLGYAGYGRERAGGRRLAAYSPLRLPRFTLQRCEPWVQ